MSNIEQIVAKMPKAENPHIMPFPPCVNLPDYVFRR